MFNTRDRFISVLSLTVLVLVKNSTAMETVLNVRVFSKRSFVAHRAKSVRVGSLVYMYI